MVGLLGVIWSIGKFFGYAWDAFPSCRIGPLRRRYREYLWVALVAGAFTAGYFWKIEELPHSMHQSEGMVGLGAYRLAEPSFKYNIFANDIQPYTSLATRAIGISLLGNRLEPLRYVTALTSGIGLIFAFLALRAMFGFLPSILATALMAGAHVILHYSRMGYNNIDSMYWIFVIILVFYAAETAGPGVGRNIKYYVVGVLCGASFGVSPAAVLGAAVTLPMAFRRALSQRDFFRSRGLGFCLLLLGFGMGIFPFVANPS